MWNATRPWIGKSVLIVCAVALLAPVAGGCRAHPVSLLGMLAGDAINDADVKDRREKLIGKPEAMADAMFGERLETLDDLEWQGLRMMVYMDEKDLFKASRYIVEVEKGKITGLAKTKRNIDGVEDLIHDANLEKKLLGKTPAQCAAGDLGRPLRTLRSSPHGQTVRLYDIRHWSDFAGARYAVLRFDGKDLCRDITLIGVSATTRKDPARRQR